MIGKSAMAERAAGSFVPRTPPNPGFSIRACAARRKQNQFVSRTPPEPGFSIRAFVERNKRKEKCAVCLETSSRAEFKTLGCNHRFHQNCLQSMLNNGQRTCPLCRTNINDSWLEEQQMAEFFIPEVVDEVIDDAWIENRAMILPGIEPRHDDSDNYPYRYESYDISYDSDDYDSVHVMIDQVENAIEDAIADHRRIEQRRNEEDLGLERLFLDESELEYARLLRDHDRDQYIERSVYYDTDISIWYTNGHFWFL